MALPIPTGKPPFSRQSPRPPRQSPQDKFEAVDDAAISRRSRECRADHGSLSSHLFFKGCECALNRCADSPVLLLGYPIDCVCDSWGYPAGKLLCAACTAPASLFWAGQAPAADGCESQRFQQVPSPPPALDGALEPKVFLQKYRRERCSLRNPVDLAYRLGSQDGKGLVSERSGILDSLRNAADLRWIEV